MTMTIAYIIHDNSNIEIYTLTCAQRKNSRSEYNQRQHWQRHLQSRKPHPSFAEKLMEAPAIFSPTPYNIKTLPTLHIQMYLQIYIPQREQHYAVIADKTGNHNFQHVEIFFHASYMLHSVLHSL